MKLLIPFFIVVLLHPLAAFAEIRIEFRVNKVQGFYNFVETISGNPHRSKVILDLFEKSSFNNPKYQALIKELNSVGASLDKGFNYDGYPKSRNMGQSMDLLFVTQSAFAKDLNDFSLRTLGILPMADHKRFFEILHEFEPVYDTLIWKTNGKKLLTYKGRLEQLSRKWKVQELFRKAAKFYGAEWPESVPFAVGLYAIPGSRGHSSAESIGAFESVGVLVDEKDIPGRFGVMFHEMCHSLYEAQSIELQKQLESYFYSSRSQYAAYAYRTLNEGLATVLGNGWASEKAAGKPDEGEWYNERYINGFAKGVYSLTVSYLDAHRTIDADFVAKSIEKYAELFPEAIYEYDNLLTRVILITDGKDITTRESSEVLRKSFRVNSLNRSSPIDANETISELQETEATVLGLSVDQLKFVDRVA